MEQNKQNGLIRFLWLILKGVPVGIAFIIPGFSGGSVAAIIGIYDELLESITGLKKHFKKSLAFLIPILIGMALGVAALIFPIKILLPKYPIIVVSFFIGLSLGGLPSIAENVGKPREMKWYHVFSFLIPFAVAAAIGFLPKSEPVDLIHMDAVGYVLLFLVGVLGASALIVPGISGSMLLLIFGYYNPIVEMATDYLLKGQMVGHALLVLVVVALGIVVGFFLISYLMRFLLHRFEKGTYIAILGFIIGSVPAAYLASCADAAANGWTFASVASSPIHWVLTALFLFIGFAISFLMVIFSKKKKA